MASALPLLLYSLDPFCSVLPSLVPSHLRLPRNSEDSALTELGAQQDHQSVSEFEIKADFNELETGWATCSNEAAVKVASPSETSFLLFDIAIRQQDVLICLEHSNTRVKRETMQLNQNQLA